MDYFRKTVRNIIIFMIMAFCIIVPNVSSAKTVSCEEIKSGKNTRIAGKMLEVHKILLPEACWCCIFLVSKREGA